MALHRVLAAVLALAALGSAKLSAQEFHGYLCTQDCSGHEAGYEWAERKGIDSVDDCGGNSNSFIEGCQAYVEENAPAEQDNAPDGEPVDN
jgi:hypothetical protein